MGRGRQKAKQTKMARKLKYMTTDTDYNELERELSSREPDAADTADDSISAADPDHDAQETGAGDASTWQTAARRLTALRSKTLLMILMSMQHGLQKRLKKPDHSRRKNLPCISHSPKCLSPAS